MTACRCVCVRFISDSRFIGCLLNRYFCESESPECSCQEVLNQALLFLYCSIKLGWHVGRLVICSICCFPGFFFFRSPRVFACLLRVLLRIGEVPRTIKDHTLFNKMCLVVSCIKTHHTPHRWQSGDRKISNGKGSVGRQHLLQLQRPLTEL